MSEHGHKLWATVVVVVAVLAAASAAAGIGWHTNGSQVGTAFSATGPKTVIAFTSYDVPAVSSKITCSETRLEGKLIGPTAVATVFASVMTFTPTLTGCTTSTGPLPVAATCTQASFHAETWFGGGWATGTTTGYIQNFECLLRVHTIGCGTGGDPGIRFIGNMYKTTYRNSTGTFTAPTTGTPSISGQTLNAVWSTTCRPIVGNADAGTALVTNTSGEEAYTATVTSAFRPTITRTP